MRLIAEQASAHEIGMWPLQVAVKMAEDQAKIYEVPALTL